MTNNVYEWFVQYRGLRASAASFERALNTSLFFSDKLRSWQNYLTIEHAYEIGVLGQWMSRFELGLDGANNEENSSLSRSWLIHCVNELFDMVLDEQATMVVGYHERYVNEIQCLMKRLRFLRHVCQVRAIYRECSLNIGNEALFLAQMTEYSQFAHIVFERSESYLRQHLAAEWQIEVCPPPLIILALGKLGAGELNLSSDVDLIFAYDHEVVVKASRERTASEFYTRLGQKLIKFLSDITGDGFVFRIDMRLRPFGQSGALVWSTYALEQYYAQQGRMWERYAWIKTQALTGGVAADNLCFVLKPFVYRRYVDFSVIESLREMKSLIEREVNQKDAQDNIKIGRGGIREVEFIIQVVQLIRGGEFPELQVSSLMSAMKVVKTLGLLPTSVINELRQDYIFLRRVEHFLQAYEDRQTQTLPSTESQWSGLLAGLGYTNKNDFEQAIQLVRVRIHEHFQYTIRPPQSDQVIPDDVQYWSQAWPNDLEKIADTRIRAQLYVFLNSAEVNKASAIACHRLDILMPMMLSVLEKVNEEVAMSKEATLSYQLQVSLPELEICWAGFEQTLARLLVMLESILRRSAYLSLLIENPLALYRVVKLCGMSAWLPVKLSRHPSLLNELLDDTPVYKPPTREQLIDELRQQLVRIPEDDFEQQMGRLRDFKHRHTLRVAVADISGQLSLMKVSDYLTWLGEVLLQAALDIAWRKLTVKYGQPSLYPAAGSSFIIVGYGKLGGIELSYASDLDIVFLYDAPADGETDGPRVVENGIFYVQLVKNLNHILMTDTLSGRLYEIDMRLRPSGSSGLFVSTFEGFQKYQEQNAWIWERQALVRARPVAGDQNLFLRFNMLRMNSLSSIKTDKVLTQSVLDMRTKMQTHLQNTSGQFDLKYSPGGLVDIEFLAQHLVLMFTKTYPSVAKYTDNVRIFESAVVVGLLSKDEGDELTHAYLLYRALIHRLNLQNQPSLVEPELLVNTRTQVQRIFTAWFSKFEERLT